MTDSPSTTDASRRYRLATFGTLALSGPSDDTVLGEHGHHRRRLALLAVLAAAGDRGRSRDQLLLLFWPDAPQSRARHSLDQLLYALRATLGATVFAGVNPVRLNRDVVRSDVDAFNAALERGDAQAAAEAYRGPFLDGFYLTEAPEFERWAESERSRLASSYAAALERLARFADAAAEHEAAVRWWQALTETDPLSSRYAAGRIRSLVGAGDQPAALQFARRYESLVAQELGTTVDPLIAALVRELRSGARVERPTTTATPSPAPRRHADEDVVAAVSVGRAPHDWATPAPPHGAAPPGPWVGHRRVAYLTLALLCASVTLTALRRSRTHDPELGDAMTPPRGVAAAVTRALAIRSGTTRLPRGRRGATHSVVAHEFYQRGSDPTAMRTDSGARAALEHLRQAIALDPGYAAAHAGLALLHLRVSESDSVSRRTRLALAEQAALKAIALDDSLAEGHASLSFVRGSDLDMSSAETEMQRAVSLDPTNARLHEYMAQLYVTTDQPELALAEANRALKLDPLAPTAVAEVAHALLANDRCDEALAQLAQLRALKPPLLRAESIAAQCYARKRMWPEAIAAAQRTTRSSRGLSLLGHVLGRAGRTADAERVAASLIDRARRQNGGAFDVAMVYAGLGDNDRAFAWLDRAVEERSVSLQHHYELVRRLAPDPRFDRFRERLGIRKR